MTAIEFLEINGLNSIPYRQDVLDVMKEFAIYCCEKQREICADNAEFFREGASMKNDLWPAYDHCKIDIEYAVNKESIINSPLPEELQ